MDELSIPTCDSTIATCSAKIELINDTADLKACLAGMTSKLGYEHYLMLLYVPHHVKDADYLVISNRSKRWVDNYIQNEIYLVDPIVKYATCHSMPKYWNEHHEELLEAAMEEKYSDDGRHAKSGMTLPVKSQLVQYGMITMNGYHDHDENLDDENLAVGFYLAAKIKNKIDTLIRSSKLIEEVSLTKKEMSLLITTSECLRGRWLSI